MVPIRRNFYPPKAPAQVLDEIVEVSVGAFMSVRFANVRCLLSFDPVPHATSPYALSLTQQQRDKLNAADKMPPPRLGLNVDVAHTAMWVGGQTLLDLATRYLEATDPRCRPAEIMRALSPVQKGNMWVPSEAFMHLRKLQKIRFTCPHQGKGTKVFTVARWLHLPELGDKIANARNVTFEVNGKMTSIHDYFAERYKIRLRNPQFPLIETTKKGTYFPMEVCVVEHNQRYPFKLSPNQVCCNG
jgi:hypothetical protein